MGRYSMYIYCILRRGYHSPGKAWTTRLMLGGKTVFASLGLLSGQAGVNGGAGYLGGLFCLFMFR